MQKKWKNSRGLGIDPKMPREQSGKATARAERNFSCDTHAWSILAMTALGVDKPARRRNFQWLNACAQASSTVIQNAAAN